MLSLLIVFLLLRVRNGAKHPAQKRGSADPQFRLTSRPQSEYRAPISQLADWVIRSLKTSCSSSTSGLVTNGPHFSAHQEVQHEN